MLNPAGTEADIAELHTSRSSMMEETNLEEASLVIETIRREEFGLDQALSDTENSLLKKQHARLGRALHCLSQELYSQDSHLLLELVSLNYALPLHSDFVVCLEITWKVENIFFLLIYISGTER
jgi:hypothetical protein